MAVCVKIKVGLGRDKIDSVYMICMEESYVVLINNYYITIQMINKS